MSVPSTNSIIQSVSNKIKELLQLHNQSASAHNSLFSNKADASHTHSEYINPQIIDNLSTIDNTKPLSAKQGYILNNDIDDINDDIDQVKIVMVGNLVDKGVVNASSEDTLMDLADMILDIPDKTYIITQLELNAGLPVYTDTYQITGTLKDINGNPLANKPIKLTSDGVYLATRNTDNNGVATFTLRADGIGNSYNQLIFEGDSTYSGSMSYNTYEDVQKETSVIRIDAPVDDGFYEDTELITIEGYLIDNDNQPVKSRTVNINVREI